MPTWFLTLSVSTLAKKSSGRRFWVFLFWQCRFEGKSQVQNGGCRSEAAEICVQSEHRSRKRRISLFHPGFFWKPNLLCLDGGWWRLCSLTKISYCYGWSLLPHTFWNSKILKVIFACCVPDRKRTCRAKGRHGDSPGHPVQGKALSEEMLPSRTRGRASEGSAGVNL